MWEINVLDFKSSMCRYLPLYVYRNTFCLDPLCILQYLVSCVLCLIK